MDSNLINELKTNNYPFTRKVKIIDESHEWYDDEDIRLEDAIAACGEKFYGLFHTEDLFGNMKWFAQEIEGEGMIDEKPREAVLKLWLSINKK